MIPTLHLDTHAVLWLYARQHRRFPPATRARLNTDALRCSPMVRLELAYLVEIGRATDPPERVFADLAGSVGLAIDDQPFDRVADIAARTTFTRDPFDRVIAAQAIAAGVRLVTKDERIRAALPDVAMWD